MLLELQECLLALPTGVSVPHSGSVPHSLLPQQKIAESLSDSITLSAPGCVPQSSSVPEVVSPHMTRSLKS